MNAAIKSVRLVLTNDDDPDLSWLEPDSGNYDDCTSEEKAHYLAQDAERLAGYGTTWWSVGVSAVAQLQIGSVIGNKVSTAGLWGIESDSDDGYFDQVGADELCELREMLVALCFSTETINEAFANITKDW
jgi:hypothetical protein